MKELANARVCPGTRVGSGFHDQLVFSRQPLAKVINGIRPIQLEDERIADLMRSQACTATGGFHEATGSGANRCRD